MEVLRCKIGDLFENFHHLNDKQRVKTRREVQEFVAERFKQITKLDKILYYFVLVNKPRICVPYRIQFNNKRPDHVNFVFILLLYELATALK